MDRPAHPITAVSARTTAFREQGSSRTSSCNVLAGHQAIRTGRDRHRTLGVGAQRQARDAQHSGLFLYATGIGYHRGRPSNQPEEFEIADRVNDQQLRMFHQACLGKALSPARMQGQDDVRLVGHGMHGVNQAAASAGSSTLLGR